MSTFAISFLMGWHFLDRPLIALIAIAAESKGLSVQKLDKVFTFVRKKIELFVFLCDVCIITASFIYSWGGIFWIIP